MKRKEVEALLGKCPDDVSIVAHSIAVLIKEMRKDKPHYVGVTLTDYQVTLGKYQASDFMTLQEASEAMIGRDRCALIAHHGIYRLFTPG